MVAGAFGFGSRCPQPDVTFCGRGEDHWHGLVVNGLHNGVRFAGQEAEEVVQPNDGIGLNATYAVPGAPKAGEGGERASLVERGPGHVLAFCRRVWRRHVVAEAGEGDEAAMSLPCPALPMTRREVAEICHWCARRSSRSGHSPTSHRELAHAIRIGPHDGRGVIRIDPRLRREITGEVVECARGSADRLDVRRMAVQVTHAQRLAPRRRPARGHPHLAKKSGFCVTKCSKSAEMCSICSHAAPYDFTR